MTLAILFFAGSGVLLWVLLLVFAVMLLIDEIKQKKEAIK